MPTGVIQAVHLSLSNLNLFVLLPSETNFSSEQVTTTIGYGSPNKANLYSVHGSALDATRKNLGWPFEPFYVPEDVNKHWSRHVPDGAALETEWNAKFADYEMKYKEEAAELKSISTGELPAGWEKALPTYTPENPTDATRNLSQQCLNALTKVKAGVETQDHSGITEKEIGNKQDEEKVEECQFETVKEQLEEVEEMILQLAEVKSHWTRKIEVGPQQMDGKALLLEMEDECEKIEVGLKKSDVAV
ncbi:hypothetical protein RHGRI_012137 [Rhododendron griersonianum]|uniref:Transketolase N-terminal domain-containing protein n=1 Tax=Rhododendron griersonianum TaxID=479676 RepID=A0AAV6KPX7_9ERIC|nr:hypothetical protein RHGRI_012137 [Rhododendron griersonianum]